MGARSGSRGSAAAPKRSRPSQHVCAKLTAPMPVSSTALAACKSAAGSVPSLFSLVGLQASQKFAVH